MLWLYLANILMIIKCRNIRDNKLVFGEWCSLRSVVILILKSDDGHFYQVCFSIVASLSLRLPQHERWYGLLADRFPWASLAVIGSSPMGGDLSALCPEGTVCW